MTTNFYPADVFKLFVTEAPFELDGFIQTVDMDSYEESGVDEEISYYVASDCPTWNVENDYGFTVATIGDNYEDDYTKVEVKQEGIYFTTKIENLVA